MFFAFKRKKPLESKLSKLFRIPFPKLPLARRLRTLTGKFVSGIETANLTVLEDGHPIPVNKFSEKEIGVQIVVAINPSPPMDTRDTLGLSRYDKIA